MSTLRRCIREHQAFPEQKRSDVFRKLMSRSAVVEEASLMLSVPSNDCVLDIHAPMLTPEASEASSCHKQEPVFSEQETGMTAPVAIVEDGSKYDPIDSSDQDDLRLLKKTQTDCQPWTKGEVLKRPIIFNATGWYQHIRCS